MTDFAIHDTKSAPTEAQPLLEKSQSNYGMIPNLHGIMAESPAHLEAYQMLGDIFQKKTSLSTEEQHVVWLTCNYENNCHYCMPAHTFLAKQAKVADEHIIALREGKPLSDPKLQTLREFTRKMVVQRGWVEEADIQAMLDVGYSKKTLLDVIVGISHKVLSNYTNHLADTPIDEPFKKFDWKKS